MKSLKEYRVEKGLTQQDLAYKARLSIKSVSDYETRGLGFARFDTVKKLCELLDADINKIK